MNRPPLDYVVEPDRIVIQRRPSIWLRAASVFAAIVLIGTAVWLWR